MPFLRGSQNYVWSTTSVLGKGATGAVYQGVHNVTGEPVAVKTFNQISQLRPQDVQMREFEVLQKVDHENIVKLLAIEEERVNRGKVIVMQLCTGGSLFNILDDPENTYGLGETDFLAVLEDLTAGMKHLRDNHLVHRDLKPGNIMKYISDDGRTIYKLTDFGAARELPEGQQFQSLYGTEEYLHPDLYERAVLKKPANKTFGATIDLWSIGVTLYHVAAGSLPFRPFSGRNDKETMYHITTKKASGVISGIQINENGPIIWKRSLPDHCQLSVGLRRIVTPLLAGLLEVDSKHIWTFEKFFAQVTDILTRRRLNIFHVNHGTVFRIYIHPDENYVHLQNYVTEQTDISADSQIFLFKSQLFVRTYGRNRAGGYPTTTEMEPMFLFHKDDNNVVVTVDKTLPPPDFEDFTATSVESDASQAKDACSLGYVCKKRIERYSLACQLFTDSVQTFCTYLNDELTQLNGTSRHLVEKTQIYRKLTPFLRNCQLLLSHGSTTNADIQSVSHGFVTETSKKITEMHETYTVNGALKRKWDVSVKCENRRAPERARTEVERLRESWQHLVRDRATRTLSHNDEQFHILERIKITHTVTRLKSLLLKDVTQLYEHIAEALGDWYKIAQTVYLKIIILQEDVRVYEQDLKKFELELTVENEEFLAGNPSDNHQNASFKPNEKIVKNYLEKCSEERTLIQRSIKENAGILLEINAKIRTLQASLQ